MQRAPMNAGAADTFARQKRADTADRQRLLVGEIAERQRVDRIVPHQFEARRIAHFVAHRRQDEIGARGAVLALFQSHHVQAGLGQFARHDGAGPTQPDRDRIDFFQSRHHVRLPL